MENRNRKKLLINFGYYRKQWIAPFEQLANSFKLVYLFYIDSTQEQAVYTKHERVFWSDFKGAKELLSEINPDRVIFMDLNSGLGIALNLACRNRNIPTYLMQHGLYHNYKDYRKRDIQSKKLRTKKDVIVEGAAVEFSSLTFLRHSIGLLDFFKLSRLPFYLLLLKLEGHTFASRYVRFEARKPDHYLCYTPSNALIHRELDGDIEERCYYIGNPELYQLDKQLRNGAKLERSNDYFLLIDQPFADNRYQEKVKTKKEMIAFYLGLSNWCRSKSKRLVIKLHPESFHSLWLPEDENIEWIKETDSMASLILNSDGCFGYFSTLMLPVILHKPTVLFQVGESPFYNDIRGFGMAQIVPFMAFDQIILRRKEDCDNLGFVNHYFYQIDKNPVEVLKGILG